MKMGFVLFYDELGYFENDRDIISLGLKLCNYCHQDFILFGISASQFKLLHNPHRIEKHHRVPDFHLQVMLEPVAGNGAVSTIKTIRKPADEDVTIKLKTQWESAVFNLLDFFLRRSPPPS